MPVKQTAGFVKKGGHIEGQNMSGTDIYKGVVKARIFTGRSNVHFLFLEDYVYV